MKRKYHQHIKKSKLYLANSADGVDPAILKHIEEEPTADLQFLPSLCPQREALSPQSNRKHKMEIELGMLKYKIKDN